MRKINKQTADYISNAIKYYTLENKNHVKKVGRRSLFAPEFFDQLQTEALQQLEEVTRKK